LLAERWCAKKKAHAFSRIMAVDPSQLYETPEYFSLSFPSKLAMILEKEDPSIIQWSKNGRSFRIVNYEQFVDIILPKYFSRKFIVLFKIAKS
jgi:hypothetical protein